jgi:hypothetical protein
MSVDLPVLGRPTTEVITALAKTVADITFGSEPAQRQRVLARASIGSRPARPRPRHPSPTPPLSRAPSHAKDEFEPAEIDYELSLNKESVLFLSAKWSSRDNTITILTRIRESRLHIP